MPTLHAMGVRVVVALSSLTIFGALCVMMDSYPPLWACAAVLTLSGMASE
jgi:hypothetical protein